MLPVTLSTALNSAELWADAVTLFHELTLNATPPANRSRWTGGESTEEKSGGDTNSVFVTLTEGNAGKMCETRLEMRRRKRGSVKCSLRTQMNVRTVKCTLISGYTLNIGQKGTHAQTYYCKRATAAIEQPEKIRCTVAFSDRRNLRFLKVNHETTELVCVLSVRQLCYAFQIDQQSATHGSGAACLTVFHSSAGASCDFGK